MPVMGKLNERAISIVELGKARRLYGFPVKCL